jgi:hypothetical protein
MTIVLQRAQVLAIVKAISGIGVVNDYQRIKNDPVGFAAEQFIRAGKVNGWVIHSEPIQPERLTCGEQEQHTRFTIRGYLSADDTRKSLKTAENLIQTITDTLVANPRLNGTATWSEMPVPDPVITQLVTIGEGAHLCQVITIRFVSHERVAVTYV